MIQRNINFDDLCSYQSKEPDLLCVLRVNNTVIKVLTTGEPQEYALTTDENIGTSRRDQTFSIKLRTDQNVTALFFPETFLIAELIVYEGKIS